MGKSPATRHTVLLRSLSHVERSTGACLQTTTGEKCVFIFVSQKADFAASCAFVQASSICQPDSHREKNRRKKWDPHGHGACSETTPARKERRSTIGSGSPRAGRPSSHKQELEGKGEAASFHRDLLGRLSCLAWHQLRGVERKTCY